MKIKCFETKGVKQFWVMWLLLGMQLLCKFGNICTCMYTQRKKDGYIETWLSFVKPFLEIWNLSEQEIWI
jgi:hypothetical protein